MHEAATSAEASDKYDQDPHHNVATATSAVTGIPDFAWATESVMTPVIVPGLAAKRMSDGLASGVEAAGGDPGGRPRSMANPSQASTPPR
jgi:hypothetical protein